MQMGAAAAVAALIGRFLDGAFPLDDTGDHMVSCALSMKSASACTAGYISSVVSILLSLALIALQASAVGRLHGGVGRWGTMLVQHCRCAGQHQPNMTLLAAAAAAAAAPLSRLPVQCATAEGRAGMGFCGPILSAVGFFWWVAYAGSATSAAMGAGRWEDSLDSYRYGGWVGGRGWG